MAIGKIKSKPIIQYNLDMKKINEFKSINEASKFLQVHPYTISNICNNKYNYNKHHRHIKNYILEWKLDSC